MNLESVKFFKIFYMCDACGKTFFGVESPAIDFMTGMADCPDCKQQVVPFPGQEDLR